MVESAMHWFIKKAQEDSVIPNYVRIVRLFVHLHFSRFLKEMQVLENLKTLLKVPKYRFIFAREAGVEP
jgi:hypothetical protein